MKCTKLLPNIQNELKELLNKYPLVTLIAQAIAHSGGQVFIVGGAVRDLLLSKEVYDIDLEVHALSLEQLESILSTFGPVSFIGKSFGILKLHGLEIDFALPRSDSQGRKPEVSVNPAMGIEDALRRRDLTMNALAIDIISYQLIDPFNGYTDVLTRTLRSPDTQFFTQDPLRFFRVMQFISRFEMVPDSALNRVCATMSLQDLSIERIEDEFEKLLLKSAKPSLGIRWLRSIGRLYEILPELAATINVPQEYDWHPEGDVFEHSMQALDAAAQLVYDTQEQKLIALYAALCHDLGKAVTTQYSNGRIRSHGHDDAGAPISRALLKRITRKNKIIDIVPLLVKAHMQPFSFIKQNASPAAYKRLALKLAPLTTLKELSNVARADKQGRNKLKGHPLPIELPALEAFIKKAQDYGVWLGKEDPLLQGRDIADFVPVGPQMGKALKFAYELQIKKNIHDKQELKKYVKQYMQK
ncbi:HD domain-containing protein [Candidatus Dependentiae bacterium]|nr:HD domain-containing protein [Candidatus Dependentiae bacterium]